MPLRRQHRFLLAGLAVVVLAALALIVSAAGQTWLAQRLLAVRPGWGLAVGSVSAGWEHVHLAAASWSGPEGKLSVPSLEAEIPLWSAWREGRWAVRRLVARGWTLDLSRDRSKASRGTADELQAALEGFRGVLPQLLLPVDLTLDGVELSGVILLPEQRGRVELTLRGGGLQPGGEARFPVSAKAILQAGELTSAEWVGDLKVRLGDSRTVEAVAWQGDVAASGARVPVGIRLAVAASAARHEGRESYAVSLWSAERPLAMVTSEFDPEGKESGSAWSGAWMLDVRDQEVAPLALGVPLPRFELKGEGHFEAERTWQGLAARGTLEADAGELGRWREALAPIGEARVQGRFDLERRGGTWSVRTLEATLASGRPVAEVRVLQSFRLDPAAGRVQPSEPEQDLLAVNLRGLPLRWLSPWLPGMSLTGGDVAGTLVARARGQGLVWRVTRPVVVAGVHVEKDGRPCVDGLDVSFDGSGDLGPQGWQTVVSRLRFSRGESDVVLMAGKVGRLAGPTEPWRLTGQVSGDLARLLAQPIMNAGVNPATGRFSAEFAASVGEKQELQAKVALRQLTPAGGSSRSLLPEVELDVRAERDARGKVLLRVPVLVVSPDRRSELVLAGSLEPRGAGWRIEAQLTGGDVFLEDLTSLSALASGPPGPEAGKPVSAPWSGWEGTVDLHLRRVLPTGGLLWSNVTGTLRLEAGQVKLEGGRVSLAEGEVRARGAVAASADRQHLILLADVEGVGLNPAAWSAGAAGPAEPTVEGRFDFTSRWRSRSATWAGLVARGEGEMTATSRGGIFRGLPASAAAVAENSSRLSVWLASAGSALGALTGRRGEVDIAGRAPAVAELVRALHPLPYDQLSLVLARSANGRWSLRDLALISPELRLSGGGEAAEGDVEGGLTLDLQLRARGRAAELLRYLGALRGEPDALGYTPSSLPVQVGGTWAHPDATVLNQRLAALAVERNGLADKAAEWLQRLRGLKPTPAGAK